MLYKKHHKNKYIHIIYTQNYELKQTIKYITIAYISKLLKLLIFLKYIYFFCLGKYKMAQENIWFHKNNGESYDMVDLYLDDIRLFGYKDSYNYYIDVKKISLIKNGYNKYIFLSWSV